MSSFFGGGSSSSSAPNSSEELKTALMKQIQAEAAMTNARALMSVRSRLISDHFRRKPLLA